MRREDKEKTLTEEQVRQKMLYQRYKQKYAEYQKTHKHVRDAWKKENEEHLKEYRKAWNEENKEHIRKYQREWARKYRAKLKAEKELLLKSN